MEVTDMQKNWRGLPIHPVDEWDHWTNKLSDYEEMLAIWDKVSHVPVDDLMAFAEMVRKAEAQNQADCDAGEDL